MGVGGRVRKEVGGEDYYCQVAKNFANELKIEHNKSPSKGNFIGLRAFNVGQKWTENGQKNLSDYF